MKGFNKIEITYECDLNGSHLKEVFRNWKEKPSAFDLRGWGKSLESGYFIIDEVSSNHLFLQRKIRSKGLIGDVEVRYDSLIRRIIVNVSTPYRLLFYIAIPLVSMVVLSEKLFDFQEYGYWPLIGFVVALFTFSGIVLSISSSEKYEIQKDLEQQLHYNRIRYKRLA